MVSNFGFFFFWLQVILVFGCVSFRILDIIASMAHCDWWLYVSLIQPIHIFLS